MSTVLQEKGTTAVAKRKMRER